MSHKDKYLQEQAEQLERIRRDFVANVSHELRTPLTVISGYIETMRQKKADFPDDWQRIFDQMHHHSLRMQNLIEDLLLLSKLEATDPEQEQYQEINITQMLEQLAEDAKNISGAESHNIKLHIDSNLKIKGIETELKSLFGNLIVNAVKYTPAGGDILISWNDKNEQAVFCVKDTGIGIAAEHLSRVTERFYRIDKARSRESGGTGLGLAIVKHVLLRHDAELIIHSEENVGSEFCCWFSKELTIC